MVTFIPQGWQCPVCHKVHAPWVASCDCHKSGVVISPPGHGAIDKSTEGHEWKEGDHWVADCALLDHKQADYRRMLYTMTSRTDWQQAGYDVAEYDALVEEFEGEDKP